MKHSVQPPRQEYIQFLSLFGPGITQLALAVRRLVLEEAPASTELIYDAYNAVATGYSFTGRPSDAFVHIAVYAHWVNLGFNWGVDLPDPEGVLEGSGRRIRHIRISQLADLEKPMVRRLVKAAAARAERPHPKTGQAVTPGGSVVRAIYARRRRPVENQIRASSTQKKKAARQKPPIIRES
jgi:hypothetical protein